MRIRLVLFAALCLGAVGQEPDFNYPATRLDVRVRKTERKGMIEIRDISFSGVAGKRIAAYMVLPGGTKPAPAVLYAHWYANEPDSNRFEFLDEAIDLARRGQASLLVETMWSPANWYQDRVQENDYANSIEQVKNFRRALDVLAAEPSVDASRVALVGHDFGGMYGTLTAAADPRVKALAIMAATTSWSDWYMFGKFKLEGEAYNQYVAKMAPLDPVKYMGRLTIPVLMQFAQFDLYVPAAKIQTFRKALPNAKPALIYDAGHGLDWQAARDRKAFLIDFFGLHKEPADIVHSYVAARNEGDPAKIEAFHAAEFVASMTSSFTERKNQYEFGKAARAHFEYRIVDANADSVTLDLYESNDLLEALGSGVRRLRVAYRLKGGRIHREEIASIADARRPLEEARAAFIAWAAKERPADAAKVMDQRQLRITGAAAAPLLALAKEWAKTQ